MKYKIYFYRDKKKEWRWKAKHRNGNIIADSGEGYKRKGQAIKSWMNFAEQADESEMVFQ